MKIPIACLSLALLVLATSAPAQEASNPFIKKPETAKPAAPPGPSFVSLLENILVPPDLLDDWLREHPMKQDATALRAAVQDWVVEGKAKLDHTALNLGTAGRQTTNESILETIYPTEYAPSGTGAWPCPTAFDTRNCGHDVKTGLSQANGIQSLWSEMEHVEMVSSKSYQAIIERTRQPSDIFLPKFHLKRINQRDPNESDDPTDPFAKPAPKVISNTYFNEPHGLVFMPDVVQLAGRFDPTFDANPEGELSRLVFYRGSIATVSKDKTTAAPDISRLSFRMVRVSLLAFSSWLQSHPPLSVPTQCWEATESWRKEGKAESAGELTTQARPGTKSVLKNIEEYIYPTEWLPGNDTEVIEQWEEGKKKNDKDGVSTMKRMKITPRSGIDGAGLACAFDTRNLGNTFEAVLSSDEQGLVLGCNWERVLHLGDPIYHRIKVNEEWIPNITMPLFSASRLVATVRVQPGQWTLLGSVSEYLETRKLDHEHCLLVFVKIE
ncbi:MAG: hypothetical protein ABIS50_11840 [Luteolibacter sp.]|uniref:hypothetical protein n=1 Tax=Luteolibacter sp. TaxID=1962973 RepID=UPI003262FC0A